MATAFLSYAGPFNQEYRQVLLQKWTSEVRNRHIPYSQDLNLITMLTDQATVRFACQCSSSAFSACNWILLAHWLGDQWALPAVFLQLGMVIAFKVLVFGKKFIQVMVNAHEKSKKYSLQKTWSSSSPNTFPFLLLPYSSSFLTFFHCLIPFLHSALSVTNFFFPSCKVMVSFLLPTIFFSLVDFSCPPYLSTPYHPESLSF